MALEDVLGRDLLRHAGTQQQPDLTVPAVVKDFVYGKGEIRVDRICKME